MGSTVSAVSTVSTVNSAVVSHTIIDSNVLEHIAKYSIMLPIWSNVRFEWEVLEDGFFTNDKLLVRLHVCDEFTRMRIIAMYTDQAGAISVVLPFRGHADRHTVIPVLIEAFHDAFHDTSGQHTLVPALRDCKIAIISAEITRFLTGFDWKLTNHTCVSKVTMIPARICTSFERETHRHLHIARDQSKLLSCVRARIRWGFNDVGCVVAIRSAWLYALALTIQFTHEYSSGHYANISFKLRVAGHRDTLGIIESVANTISGITIAPAGVDAICKIPNISEICADVIVYQIRTLLGCDRAIVLFSGDVVAKRRYIAEMLGDVLTDEVSV